MEPSEFAAYALANKPSIVARAVVDMGRNGDVTVEYYVEGDGRQEWLAVQDYSAAAIRFMDPATMRRSLALLAEEAVRASLGLVGDE